MYIVLFEDEFATRLYPATIGRPAFGVSCGSFRLLDLAIDLARRHGCQVRSLVRPHLKSTLPEEAPPWDARDGAGGEPSLWVNARLTPSVGARSLLANALQDRRPGLLPATPANGAAAGPPAERAAAALALACLPGGKSLPPIHTAAEFYACLHAFDLPSMTGEPVLFEYPHDLVRHHLATLGDHLAWRLSRGGYREVADGVFAAEGAQLGQYVVTDSQQGPILLEAGATVGPYSFLRGPAHLGAGARVIEQSAIKDGVALGHTTKVGGEVEGSTIEPYTNKQHHGFLGHSYLGSWVNLGAGTCNSDLKNTYGIVNMEYQGQKVSTGMQFIGAIMGDYAKTAINTGIFTGKTIGACSMLYGFVTTNVPSFVNYARLFGQVTEATVEVMVATQARMFARRGVVQQPRDVQLLQAMYDLTRHERQMAGEPLSL